MGSSQSSPTTAEGNSPKSSNAGGGRGRKTSSFLLNKTQSAPHGLTGSFVSTASSDFFKQVLSDAAADLTEEPTSHHGKIVSDEEESINDDDEDEQLELERQLVLTDARHLKKLAEFFLHPEIPVSSEGHPRCYFHRASAPGTECSFVAEEKAVILRDAASLKQSAVEYLHPELPVATTNPFACGRNFFSRPFAPGADIDFAERDAILADSKFMKARAIEYMHPETHVITTDPAACARCFFDRLSGPDPLEDYEEFESTLADISSLKELARNYLHPEHPILTTDATATARCFFNRASALEQESKQDDEERSVIMAECAALKKLAVDWKHPELPIVSDPTSSARCYFARPSAAEQRSEEEAEKLDDIMSDLAALKKFAVDYLHPEIAVQTTDPASTARSYFDRPSAPEPLTPEEAEERELVLGDAAAFKTSAVDFLHPEYPVVTMDPTSTARCYFGRASAVPRVSAEELEYRVAMLKDISLLKRLAIDYMHPELPVATTDPTTRARCYFSRFSAPEQTSKVDMDDRALVLADAMFFKDIAVDYMHPEHPVVTSDPAATARCYFYRASAPESELIDDHQERLQILADARSLKNLAVDFMHPELPVVTTCPNVLGRNFFDRPSATYHGRMIHTFPTHEHDDVDHLHEQMDHFGMEDFHMGDVGFTTVAVQGKVDFSKLDPNMLADALEGNLSRSPSSVMLFQDE